jgi:tetratricopeptide (TPR) repeat protein
MALRDAGKVEEALGELAALGESTSDPEEKAALLGNESTCLVILGRHAEAKEKLALARKIAPETQSRLYLDFAEAGLYLDEGRCDEALEILDNLRRHYNEILSSAGHRDLNERIRVYRATALVALARFGEARRVLEECLRFQLSADDQQHVLYNLGVCCVRLGERERGKRALLEALEKGLHGRNAVSAHYYLGTIYFEEGAYAKALMELEWCLAHVEQGQVPKKHVCEWLASAARALGMKEDAERYDRLAKG